MTESKDAAPGLGVRRACFFLMIPLWLAFDLASKRFMFAYLNVAPDAGPGGPLAEPVWVLDGFVRWSAHMNTGAAFGLGRDHPWAVFGLTLLLLPVLTWMAWTNRAKGAPLWALGCVVGGALGNLHDRLWEPGVRDFIELVKPWSPSEMLWPVFNVADIGIVGGVCVYYAWTLFQPSPKQPADRADDVAEPSEEASGAP